MTMPSVIIELEEDGNDLSVHLKHKGTPDSFTVILGEALFDAAREMCRARQGTKPEVAGTTFTHKGG
jgi:hypothetical protein